MLTINLDKGLDPVDSDAVMTGGETVYGSTKNLYIATQRYRPEPRVAHGRLGSRQRDHARAPLLTG